MRGFAQEFWQSWLDNPKIQFVAVRRTAGLVSWLPICRGFSPTTFRRDATSAGQLPTGWATIEDCDRLRRYLTFKKELMRTYLDLLAEVIAQGIDRPDRTGTGTRGLFGRQMRFNLDPATGGGFPLLTTKRVHFKSVAHELLWFLRGETNVRSLQAAGVRIWNQWADADGELGPVYGHQWRSWSDPGGGVIDQIARVQNEIRVNPHSRRLIVSAWNPADVPHMALPPCHTLFQFYVSPDRDGGPGTGRPGRLSCQLYQRSGDLFLGVPFNIASYALLTRMMAHATGLAPGDFVHTLGDVHLYHNHFDQAREQLARTPTAPPQLRFARPVDSIDDFRYEDFQLIGYSPQPPITAPVAV